MGKKRDVYFLTHVFGTSRGGLEQYGVPLDLGHPSLPPMATYSSEIHLGWIEQQKRSLKQRTLKNIAESRRTFTRYKDVEQLLDLLKSIWPTFEETRSARPAQAARDEGHSSYGYARQLISPQVQNPVISHLHELEIKRINQRIQELEPERDNPVIVGLYQFNVLSKQVIEAWFVEMSLAIPLKARSVEHASKEVVPIRLDVDTNMAIKGGIEYPLTPNQFKVVSFLLEASTSEGDGWKSFEAIQKHTKIGAKKMYEVFRDNEPAWNDLIDRPSGQRIYRLKI